MPDWFSCKSKQRPQRLNACICKNSMGRRIHLVRQPRRANRCHPPNGEPIGATHPIKVKFTMFINLLIKQWGRSDLLVPNWFPIGATHLACQVQCMHKPMLGRIYDSPRAKPDGMVALATRGTSWEESSAKEKTQSICDVSCLFSMTYGDCLVARAFFPEILSNNRGGACVEKVSTEANLLG